MKVTLKDAANAQLSAGGSTVTLATTAGTLLGSLIDHGDGTYTQLIKAPTASAIASLTATVDGQTIENSATLLSDGTMTSPPAPCPPSPSPSRPTARARPLMLQAKDASGISIPVGGVTGLSLQTTAGTLLGTGLTDNNNGTYTQSLRAPAAAVNATVTAWLGATSFSDTASVSFFAANNLAGLTIHCSNIATYKNGNILVDNGTLVMNSTGSAGSCASNFVFASVIVRNSGVITHDATTPTQEYGLEFTAASVSIDASSKIDVSGKGYPGHTNTGYFRVQGNQLVQNKIATSYTRAGGTYGGEGGVYSTTDAPSKVYGSVFQPAALGSSGGAWNTSYLGGAGGGRVKITVSSSGSLTVDGQILALGGDGTYGGGGSGGSIWIDTPQSPDTAGSTPAAATRPSIPAAAAAAASPSTTRPRSTISPCPRTPSPTSSPAVAPARPASTATARRAPST